MTTWHVAAAKLYDGWIPFSCFRALVTCGLHAPGLQRIRDNKMKTSRVICLVCDDTRVAEIAKVVSCQERR